MHFFVSILARFLLQNHYM